MASKDSLEIRKLNEVGTTVSTTSTGIGTNLPVAIRIRKKGTETATSVTLTTATQIELIGSTTTDTLTFTGGATNYNTVGALADAINATGRWEAIVLDALRSDACISRFTDSTVTAGTDANGVVVWDVTTITTALKATTATLSLHRNFDTVGKGHVVALTSILYYLTLGGAGGNLVRIYQRKGSVETQLAGFPSVSAAATTINFASGYGELTGADDADLVVRVQDGTSISGTALDMLQISGVLR